MPSFSERSRSWLAAAHARLIGPGCAASLSVLAVFVVLRAFDPALFEEVRLRSFDLEQRIAPRSQGALPVAIVEIDDASLEPPYGQWPWPRTEVASLVRKIASGHPLALGVDIIFSEPDRTSPETLAASLPDLPPPAASELATLPHNDTILADAFRSVPTVLGVGAAAEPVPGNAGRIDVLRVRGLGGDPRPFLPQFPGLVFSLPEITKAASGQASLYGDPDSDGIVRRVSLFIDGGGDLVAGLSVESLRVAFRAGAIGIVTTPSGIVGGRLLDFHLPTDEHGRAYPYFRPQLGTNIVSASELLSGAFDPAAFKGRIVLLGVTGLGLVDLKQTPLGLMQGIEVQAQLIESIVLDELLRRPGWLLQAEMALAAAIGLLTIFALPYRKLLVAGAWLIGIVVACLGMGFIAFYFDHLLLDGILPSVAAIATFSIMLGANLRAAEAARQVLAQQLEHQRGELNAARAIQMGLLPRRFPAFPETKNIDVHALIESARMVGGDLYDFLMLDSSHLFFVIADVSGKGVAAALFMAMTKEVLHAATLQNSEALDIVFADANAKISSSSAEARAEGGSLMFVTVFAAILDLSTGTIFYVSAGHDSPYVLSAGAPPRRLETEGGPPLGTVDDFPFPVDRAQLAPGDVLLLFTDGVTEAKDGANVFYTSGRLDRLVTTLPTATAKSVVELVREDVRHFVGDAEQADDITLLAVRWLGPQAG